MIELVVVNLAYGGERWPSPAAEIRNLAAYQSSVLRRGNLGLQAGEETPLPPSACQASALNRTFGCVRVVWNKTLAS